MRMMSESSTLAQISAYVTENKLIVAFEAISQETMVVEAIEFKVQIKEIVHNG